MEQTINAFKANPGSDYELYYGEDFKVDLLLTMYLSRYAESNIIKILSTLEGVS